MLFRVLGPIEADTGSGVVRPGGFRPRALLAALLLQPRLVVPATRLAEQIWDGTPPEPAEPALHTTVARLRRALGGAGEYVVTRPPGYLLDIDDDALDASRFERLCREARARSEPTSAIAVLDEALSLWRGTAFGEFAETFAAPSATRLEELRITALEDRTELLLPASQPAQAVAEAGDLVAAYPLRSRPVAILMRALHANGRTADALHAFQRHRSALADELGVDPPGELRDLEVAILRDELTENRPSSLARPRPPVVPTRRSDLPIRPSELLGREAELTELLETLASQRLVTLVGPGGVGKTRMAIEIAHHFVERGTRVWWVDLVPVTAERLLDTLTGAIGVEPQKSPAGLAMELSAHRGTLVLDNAEHLLDPLAALAERIVDAARGVTVLVTSRERLALDVETVRALPPLRLPETGDRNSPAVVLFLRRGGLDGEPLGDEDLSHVVEICRRLDGLPLAIELAAARSTALGVDALAARLDDRLDLLGGGRRSAADRHRALRSVVDWSHGLLTTQEARLFARLSVFPSRFTLDQAEAVCADDGLPKPTVAGVLARLVEQSLVEAAHARFWLLETLRAYARERVASAELESLRRRHAHDTAERLTRLRRQLWTRDEARAVRDITGLLPDLLVAWDYAVAHDRRLGTRLAAHIFDFAYPRQRLELLQWSVQAAAWEVDNRHLPDVLASAACAAWAAGNMQQAREYVEKSIDVAGGADQPAAALAIDIRADLDMFAGRSEQAVAGYRKVIQLRSAHDGEIPVLMSEVAACQARSYGPRRDELRTVVPQLLTRAERLGNPTLLCFANFVAGEVWRDIDSEAALRALAAGVEHGERAHSRLFVMLARTSTVALLTSHGPPRQALEAFRDVLEHWEELGNHAAQWWCLSYLVILLDGLGQSRDAALLGGAARAARERKETFSVLGVQDAEAFSRTEAKLEGDHPEEMARGATMTLAEAVSLSRQATHGALASIKQ